MGAQWNDGRRFEGRVAVVTGGGGTLGGAVARGFGSEGASVAIGYRSSRSQAAEVVAELEGRGGQAHSGQLDVTDQDSVDAFVADVWSATVGWTSSSTPPAASTRRTR